MPIRNTTKDANTRIVDLYLHHRTQQLMCLEFDVTHLKLDEGESSFSGDYPDTFLVNNPGCAEEASDPSQPTPFMGAPSQGAYTYG